MFECGKHGQQAIVATENFFDGTVHTLACKCRGTSTELSQPPESVAPSGLQDELDELDALLAPTEPTTEPEPKPAVPEAAAVPTFAERMKAARAKKATANG